MNNNSLIAILICDEAVYMSDAEINMNPMQYSYFYTKTSILKFIYSLHLTQCFKLCWNFSQNEKPHSSAPVIILF